MTVNVNTTRGQSNLAKAASNTLHFLSPWDWEDRDPTMSLGPANRTSIRSAAAVCTPKPSEAVWQGQTDRQTPRSSVTIVCISCIRCSLICLTAILTSLSFKDSKSVASVVLCLVYVLFVHGKQHWRIVLDEIHKTNTTPRTTSGDNKTLGDKLKHASKTQYTYRWAHRTN